MIFRIFLIALLSAMLWFSISLVGKSAWSQYSSWLAAKSWEPASAVLTNVGLLETVSRDRTDDGRSYETTYYEVRASYRYEVNGEMFTSRRVAFSSSSENNLGEYNGQTYRRLKRAKDQGEEIQIWYDPQQPSSSVIDRDLHAGALVAKSLIAFFVGVFSAVGLYGQIRKFFRSEEDEEKSGSTFGLMLLIILAGFCVLAVGMAISSVLSGDYVGLVALAFPALILPVFIEYRRFQREKARKAKAPPRNDSGVVASNGYARTPIYLGLLILLITLPIAYNEFTSVSIFGVVSYGIFSLPLVGFLMILKSTITGLVYSRIGDLVLTMTPPVLSVGEKVEGRIESEGHAFPANCDLELRCFRFAHEEDEDIDIHHQRIEATHSSGYEQRQLKFDFKLPSNTRTKHKYGDIDMRPSLSLRFKVGFLTTVAYRFEGLLVTD